ncbi:MAG: anti-sigma factor [Ideonella sp.]|nr:anti-sigma factor [Ideonella sp.]
MTHWHESPETVRRLAAAYALGTLAGPARRRFEALMATHPAAAEAVVTWNRRFVPLAGSLPPAPPQPALWARIEQAAFAAPMAQAVAAAQAVAPAGVVSSPLATATGTVPAGVAPAPSVASAGAPAPAASVPVASLAMATPPAPAADHTHTSITPPPTPSLATSPTPAPRRATAAPPSAPGLWQRVTGFLDAFLAPVPAAALAAGLAFGLVLPMVGPMLRDDSQATELPESYVGVLATAEGRTGMIVSSLRQGQVVDLKRVAPAPVPADRTLFLWVLDGQGRATPVGEVPEGPFVRVKLGAPAEQVFAQAVELGLSLEPRGSRPATPGGAYVYRGLCGKLWRVPPAR